MFRYFQVSFLGFAFLNIFCKRSYQQMKKEIFFTKKLKMTNEIGSV